MHASLSYLADDPLYIHEKPFQLFGFQSSITTTTNVQYEVRDDVPVTDVRSLPMPLRLEEAGFQLFKHKSAQQLEARQFEFASGRDAILLPYIDEMMGFVKENVVTRDAWRHSLTKAFSSSLLSSTPPLPKEKLQE
jgi:hypothetical protein